MGFHEPSVFPLVEEESGLLTAHDVGFEAKARFAELDRWGGGFTKEILPVGQSGALRRAGEISAEAEDDAGGVNGLKEPVDNRRDATQPGRGIQLEHQCPGISIYHQSRPTIAFAVDEPETVGFRPDDSVSSGECLRKPRLPPGVVELDGLSHMEDAQSEWRFGVEETRRQEPILPVIHDRELAGFAGAIEGANGI